MQTSANVVKGAIFFFVEMALPSNSNEAVSIGRDYLSVLYGYLRDKVDSNIESEVFTAIGYLPSLNNLRGGSLEYPAVDINNDELQLEQLLEKTFLAVLDSQLVSPLTSALCKHLNQAINNADLTFVVLFTCSPSPPSPAIGGFVCKLSRSAALTALSDPKRQSQTTTLTTTFSIYEWADNGQQSAKTFITSMRQQGDFLEISTSPNFLSILIS
nr:hypothetical protein [Pseudomonas luteola]